MVLAAGVLAACGKSQSADGGEATASPATGVGTGAATATATSPSDLEILERMVLQLDDLPSGLTEAGSTTSTNESIAAEEVDPEAELDRLESLGRVLGFEADFIPGPDAPPELAVAGVSSAASLYLTSEGASDSFATDAEAARRADWPAAYPDLTTLEVRDVNRPDIADEVLWVRITGLRDGGMFAEDFIVLRRDRVRGFVRHAALVLSSNDRNVLLADVADLAARQIEHIDATLSEL